jgi:hypothetical protein
MIALVPASTSFAELGFPSRALKNAYITTLSDEVLERTPKWNETDENPPVSARKAISLANGLADKLEPDNDANWKRRLEGIQLCQKGQNWFWQAEYEWRPRIGGLGGLPPFLTIIVLMDGTVVQPKVTADKQDP